MYKRPTVKERNQLKDKIRVLEMKLSKAEKSVFHSQREKLELDRQKRERDFKLEELSNKLDEVKEKNLSSGLKLMDAQAENKYLKSELKREKKIVNGLIGLKDGNDD